MEQFRKRIGLFTSLVLLVVVTLINWYSNINHKRIYTVKDQDYLSKVEKLERFGLKNLDEYNAFYEQEITYCETRTKVPFVWETVVLNSTKRQLFTQTK